MTALRPDIDPDGLLEFSVVFTDRSLNHMSAAFQTVMRDIHAMLCEVYNADTAVIVPGRRHLRDGSGRAAIRHRQEGAGYPQRLVFLSLDPDLRGGLDPVRRDRDEGAAHGQRRRRAVFAGRRSKRWSRGSRSEQPDVVFAPHVETSSGMILPDDYLRAVADAVHEVGGLVRAGLHRLGLCLGRYEDPPASMC